MLEYLHLKGVGPAPEMRIDFAPRINIITGDNGLGKTFLLDVAWWAMTHSWAGEPVVPLAAAGSKPAVSFGAQGWHGEHLQYRIPYDVSRQVWLKPHGKGDWVAHRPLVLYAAVDGSAAVWDPLVNASATPTDVRAVVPGAPASLVLGRGQVLRGLEDQERGVRLCKGLLDDWVAWGDRDGGRNAEYVALIKALEALSPPDLPLCPGRPTRLRVDEDQEYPTIVLPYGHVPVTLVSAGMQRVLSLAYLLVWMWSRHNAATQMTGSEPTDEVVLLIDEVESHLHPQWQRTLLPVLHRVTAELGFPEFRVQIIATTHAPLVLASLESFFDQDQDAAFTLDLETNNGRPAAVVNRLDWRRRGDVNHWLTSEAFGLDEARSLEQEQALQQAKAALQQPTMPLDEVRRIHELLGRTLPEIDPIWLRWIAYAEERGLEV